MNDAERGEAEERALFGGHRRRVLSGLSALLIALLCLVAGPATAARADSVRDRQWQLGFLRAEKAWEVSTGAGITVAVIDSGVNANAPDLRGQVLPGADFVDGSTDGRTDVVGHGTTVAALIAGRGDDKNGVVGLAYRAKILPIRVLDPRNQYDSADQVAKAVRWAVDHGARVINLSLGSADTAPVLADAVRYAMDHDVVVVACDGNVSNGRGTRVWHPARESGVVAVSGVESSGRFWDGSLQGPETVLSAPASGIIGAQPNGRYLPVQGTSFAAPLVSATAALIRSKYTSMNAPTVINRLIRTAWDSGPKGRDAQYGYGIVNPARALTADVPAVRENPLLKPDPGNQAGQQTPDDEQASPGSPRGVDVPQASGRDSGPPTLALVFVVISAAGVVVCLVVIAVLLILLRQRRRPAAPVGWPTGWPAPPDAPFPPAQQTSNIPPPNR